MLVGSVKLAEDGEPSSVRPYRAAAGPLSDRVPSKARVSPTVRGASML